MTRIPCRARRMLGVYAHHKNTLTPIQFTGEYNENACRLFAHQNKHGVVIEKYLA